MTRGGAEPLGRRLRGGLADRRARTRSTTCSPRGDLSHRAVRAPVRRVEAIRGFWDAEREAADEVFAMSHEVVAVEGSTGVVRVQVEYEDPVDRVYRDLWIVTLDERGRCTAFEEWPFWPRSGRAPTRQVPRPEGTQPTFASGRVFPAQRSFPGRRQRAGRRYHSARAARSSSSAWPWRRRGRGDASSHHQPGHQGGPGTGNLSLSTTSPVTWGRSTVATGKLTASPNSGVRRPAG